MELKPLLEAIVRDLVDKPDEVRISEHARETATVLELRVARSDIGKVIGKDGRTAQSMRVLLNAAATKQGFHRAFLDVVD